MDEKLCVIYTDVLISSISAVFVYRCELSQSQLFGIKELSLPRAVTQGSTYDHALLHHLGNGIIKLRLAIVS